MFFNKKNILYSAIAFSLIIIGCLFYINTTISNLIAAVFGSIVATIIVSAIYNNELHSAMDKYLGIGLINYFENFEDAQDEIRLKISRASKVDIYAMYADRFFNTSSSSLSNLLSRENTELRCFIFSNENTFISAYGDHWSSESPDSEYSSAGIISKLENVVKLISRLKNKSNSLSKVTVYQIKSAPVSYSFYRIDNELYFVPSKNIASKEIKPAVFHFKKTSNDKAMFSKIKAELDIMISDNEVVEMDL